MRCSRLFLGAVLSLALLLPSPPVKAVAGTEAGHLDRSVLLDGCAACHRGHGASRTPMLTTDIQGSCFECHGPLTPARAQGIAPAARGRLHDLGRVFQKPYRHPIETGGLHRPDEQLPEIDPGAPRHVACMDCHDTHRPRKVPARDEQRTSRKRATLAAEGFEYELCYRCHGDSANLPADSRNVRAEFSTLNASFHPVEGPGRNPEVVSLMRPLTASSTLACTDCHGNDERGGSSGPHGSIHAGLLVDRYGTRDGEAESPAVYALCYQCHNRNSILANESFPQHREHLLDPKRQTSCFTCHASHGSPDHPHLVRFNQAVVGPSRDGRLDYADLGGGGAECYLTCHGADHGPARACPPGAVCGPSVIIPATGAATTPLGASPPPGFGPSPFPR